MVTRDRGYPQAEGAWVAKGQQDHRDAGAERIVAWRCKGAMGIYHGWSESQNHRRLWCIESERDESKLTERMGERACR